MSNQHIVIFTGSGISKESGLNTFRDKQGLWLEVSLEEVASAEGWEQNPGKVLDFYNKIRKQVNKAEPNAAHKALARLEEHFRVSIITQNVDDLHERAGSGNVLHLHGEINKARSTLDSDLIYELGDRDINLGDTCELGSQLRPHLVWFNEPVPEYAQAVEIAKTADILLVIGTSLSVYPAASLISRVQRGTRILVIAPELELVPKNITWFKEKATVKTPELVDDWITHKVLK